MSLRPESRHELLYALGLEANAVQVLRQGGAVS
jgi:hypothetical protein